MFGGRLEVVRLSGLTLLQEIGPDCRTRSLEAATLRELAAFVGVDLGAGFSAGAGAPPTGDPTAGFSWTRRRS